MVVVHKFDDEALLKLGYGAVIVKHYWLLNKLDNKRNEVSVVTWII